MSPAQVGLEGGDGASLDSRWWQAFGDPHLDDLVERALHGNPDLRVAQARLDQAAARVQGAQAVDQPQVSLQGQATRQRYPEHSLYPPPIAGSVLNDADLQWRARYTFDFFGGQRAALASALGAERAARAELAAARTVLAAAVAQAFNAWAQALAQRGLAVENLSLRGQALTLARQRADAGLDSRLEQRQAEAAVAEARQLYESTVEAVERPVHALAALTVQPASAFAAWEPQLVEWPARELPSRLTADLIGRRADLVAARWRVEAATQGVAQARARFYPDVELNAFAGLSSFGLDRFFEIGSRAIGVGPALRLPIFDGGALRAGLRGREAEVDAAVAVYDATLLHAVHDAADALSALAATRQQQRAAASAVTAAIAAREIAQRRLLAGIAGRQAVINADGQVLAARRPLVDLAARERASRIQLIQALGGGWRDADVTPEIAPKIAPKIAPTVAH
jgi:NodT family efflux transporter outer membrane factor (OMF) lipoprotein